MPVRNIAYLTIITLISATTIIAPAFADDADASMPSPDRATTTVNTDAQGDSGSAPPAKHHRHAGRPGHASPLMGKIQKIRSLSSLTSDQSQKIEDILAEFKKDIKPLKQEARSIKLSLRTAGSCDKGNSQPIAQDIENQKSNSQKAGTDSQKAAAGVQQARARLSEIRKSVRAKMAVALSRVKSVLTDEQLKELDGGSASPAAKPDVTS